jgi:hypothetical protein
MNVLKADFYKILITINIKEKYFFSLLLIIILIMLLVLFWT